MISGDVMSWENKRVISIGGGKGGVGKSCFSANLGVKIAQRSKNVLLVDADIGGANLHTMVGIRYPEKTLEDFISGRQPTLESTILESPYPRLKLLSSASDILAISAPNFRERQKLMRGVSHLKTDVIVFDIAAGTHIRAIDFFSLAPTGIIIVEPLPTSLENAFTFLKNLLLHVLLRIYWQDKATRAYIESVSDPRNQKNYLQFPELVKRLQDLDPEKIRKFNDIFAPTRFNLYVVINSLKTPHQIQVGDNFVKIVKRYLMLNMKILCSLPYEHTMDEAIAKRIPFVVYAPDSGYSRGIDSAIDMLFNSGTLPPG
jgi:flagellar biosynthesis protein FlhG